MDILNLCETWRAEWKCITNNSGHVLYQYNKQIDSHLEAVVVLMLVVLVQKIIEGQVNKMNAISENYTYNIYIVMKTLRRFCIQIVQLYVPCRSRRDNDIEKLDDNITLTRDSGVEEEVLFKFKVKFK